MLRGAIYVANFAAMQHELMISLSRSLSRGIMKTAMEPRTIHIKKYENRRLYNTTDSRYVNLDEVANMLQHGDNVRVVDAATGEDITRLILTQIIIEDAKTPDSTFPLDVLRQMVIASGRAGQESALKYMKAMLDIYQKTYRAIPAALNPFEFARPKDAMHGAEPEAVPPDEKAEVSRVNAPGPGEVEELKHRVAELESLISTLAAKKVPRKKK